MKSLDGRYDLLHTFAKCLGLKFNVGKTPDNWNYEAVLYRVESDGIKAPMYTGYGLTKDEACNDLLDFIMMCNDFKSEDEMRVWIDLNDLS